MEEEMYMKIEKYFSGHMPKEEMIQFQKEIDTNTILKEEVTLYKAINFHLSDTAYEDDSFYNTDYKKKLDTYIKSDTGKKIKENLLNARAEQEQRPKNNKSSSKRFLYVAISTAAMVLLIFGFLFIDGSEKDLFAEYYKVEELPSFTSRSGKTSLLSTAKSNFRATNFDAALSNFEEYILVSDKDLDPLVFIYTSLIYAEKNDLKKAIEQLTILENSNSIDRSRSLWYKALVYLKFEKKSEAKKTLNVLLENENNYKYLEAKKLLEKL
ncbi:hypothetical protein [uncultured Aquimarina sp.]|uniref:tetratricopeptide repeat protein n=1 Tax=uncultured Aquimarina sp. TaxID=575652 RepID=UPI002601993C|nr:hypothetical protein [uncultured Aquimarina sp.]